MKSIPSFFKPSVINLIPYSSARDEYKGTDGSLLDANENAFIYQYNRYPDPYQKELKSMIGKWRDVDPECIFLGNGSDEIIDLFIRSTCSKDVDRILTLDPTYGMYKVSASVNEIPIDLVNLNPDMSVNEKAFLEAIEDAHKLIFICTPNNPTGGLIDETFIEKVLERSTGIVIVDEAYIDFAETSSWVDQLDKYSNLVVMQTFSKAVGAAGIRMGMGFMHREMVAILNKIKPPYNISSPNQEIAIERLKNLEIVEKSIARIKRQRAQLRASLERFENVVHIFPSEANFLLVRFKNALEVFEGLIAKKVIVRDRTTQMNCENCLRITVGSAIENWKLINALTEINSSSK
ncbi:MAG: histidinol-phosphate transaminase [Saprospiraceae bacterium]|nr:histidinol-phosphate transaminase [Saprospiraceae bacterium]